MSDHPQPVAWIFIEGMTLGGGLVAASHGLRTQAIISLLLAAVAEMGRRHWVSKHTKAND